MVQEDGVVDCGLDLTGCDWRSAPRRPIGARAAMTLGDGGQMEVEVTDLSTDGCRLLAAPGLAHATALTITLPFLASIAATVRWSNADATGVRFNRPIHPTLVAMLAGIRRRG